MKTFLIIYFSFGGGAALGFLMANLMREAEDDKRERKQKGWL